LFSLCRPWPLVIVTIELPVGFLTHLEVVLIAVLGTNSNVVTVDGWA
jgi:hypothetical protein